MRAKYVTVGAVAALVSGSVQGARVREQPGQTIEVLLESIPLDLTGAVLSPTHLRRAPFGSSPNDAPEMRWFFRASGLQGADTREYAFGNGSVPGGPTSSGFFVGDLSGDLDVGGMDFFITNPTSGYSFASQQRWTLQNGQVGSFSGIVLTMSNRVQNTGSGAMTIHVYQYSDLDPGGSTNHPFSGFATPQTVGAEVSLRQIDMTYGAAPPTRDGVGFWYQVAGDGSIRDALVDSNATVLNDSVTGSPGDLEVATQWQVTLGVGESMEFESFVFFGLIPSPGSSLLLGAGLLALCGRGRRDGSA